MKNKKEYYKLAESILNNEQFITLKNDIHHGTNKYDHCNRVAYVSYRLAKIFKANQADVVTAGLLHDFFFGERTHKVENSYLNHPKTSSANAKNYFNISDKVAKDIETHMFHHVLIKKILPFINYKEKATIKDNKPNSKEGAIICFSEFLVSIYEFERFKLSYSASIIWIFIINLLTIR